MLPVKLVAVALLMSAIVGEALAAGEIERTPRSKVETVFADIQTKTPWDVNAPLLWGYYFTSTGEANLEVAAKRLAADGYRFVELSKPTYSRPFWQLHVERVEHHTPDSLMTRNEDMYALASDLKLRSYDGVDVGPAK